MEVSDLVRLDEKPDACPALSAWLQEVACYLADVAGGIPERDPAVIREGLQKVRIEVTRVEGVLRAKAAQWRRAFYSERLGIEEAERVIKAAAEADTVLGSDLLADDGLADMEEDPSCPG